MPHPTAEFPPADPLADGPRWRRLDARMLLVHPVNEVVRFLPALIGVFLIGNSLDGDRWWHFAAVAIPVAMGLLRYATTSFRVADHQLQLRRGLIIRTQLTAQLDRIRTVELTASPIHRVLGLGKVEIGTAGAGQGGNERIKLDSLALPQARAMRAALLHWTVPPQDGAPAGAGQPDGGPSRESPADDEILLRLNPRWVRYAPLTTSGLVVVAAVLGASSQFAGPLIGRLIDAAHRGTGSTPIGLIVLAALAFVVIVSLLSLVGYLLNYWGFVLSRDGARRSFHVTRGLLTSRETSVDIARVRGVELHEPLGLRLARAARLSAIVTGMSRREAGVAPMVPPAPRAVSLGVGALVLGGAGPLDMPLVSHGRRAARRRYARALTVAAFPAVGWIVLALAQGWSAWLLLVAAAPPAVAVPLAADRARRLGHALTPDYLVTRAHSLRGRRAVLLREGIIGWNVRQTFFQRRAGLVTLTATTAAGKQGYRVHDLPEAVAVALADEATPGMLAPFLVPSGATGAEGAQRVR